MERVLGRAKGIFQLALTSCFSWGRVDDDGGSCKLLRFQEMRQQTDRQSHRTGNSG